MIADTKAFVLSSDSFDTIVIPRLSRCSANSLDCFFVQVFFMCEIYTTRDRSLDVVEPSSTYKICAAELWHIDRNVSDTVTR